MVKEHLDYIDKQECERRGFVRGADGRYRKRNTLDIIYEETNWLQPHANDTYNALNRFTAGKRLAKDYIKSGKETCRANDLEKVRVDGCGSFHTPEWMKDAEDRYLKAMRSIPIILRPVVRRVCCEDKPILKDKAVILRIGLDCLIRHYFWGL